MNTRYQYNLPTVVTYTLMAICVLAFLADVYFEASGYPGVMLQLGAKCNPAIDGGEYWRLFTPMFLHIGTIHLALNMLSLYIIGRHAERIYGHGRYLLVFLLSGISGNAASYFFNPDAISAGASTSIYGIMGALLVLLIRNRCDSYTKGVAKSLIPMAAINIGYNFVPGSGVDVAGHFGGLACGLVLGAVLVAFPAHQHSPVAKRPYSISRLYKNPYIARTSHAGNKYGGGRHTLYMAGARRRGK